MLRLSRALTRLAAFALFVAGSAHPAAAGSPGVISPLVRLPAAALDKPWIEATPLSWGSEARVFTPAPPARDLALAGVPEGLTMVCVGAEARATRCRRVWLTTGQALDLENPAPGARITGRVILGRRSAAGMRLSIAPVGLIARRPFNIPLSRGKDSRHLLREVVCDAQGRYVIPQLAPGQYFLEADMPGSRNGESAPFTVPDPARLRRKGDAPTTPPTLVLDDWSLDEGMQATVSVLDAAGAAIAGAEVSAIEIDAASAPAIAAVRTGTDGRATLTRLDPALALKVGCSAPGYLRSDQTFERVPRDVRCTLARLSSLAGRLVDSDDKPIGGATLTVGRSQHSAESGRSGSFAFAKLPPGRYRLTAAAPGFSALSRNIVVAAGERLDLGTLRLAPADRLFGKVVDAVSGDPVVDAAVAVVEPLGGGSTTTDGQGAFSLAVGSDSDLGLEVRATDFPVKRIVVGSDIRSTENEPLVIRISRGGRIQVTVWDEGADTPCLGCSVVLSGGESKTTALVTDTSGKATSELLEPGEWQAYLETVESIGSVVRVHGGDAIRLTTVEAGAVSHVDLGRHATLRVVFASPLPAGWSLAAEASSLHSNVPASADGSFAVRRPSGESVALSLFDGSLREVRMAVVPADYSDPVLTLPLPATSLRGALMSGKAPLQERAVSLVGAVGGSGVASAVTDDRGAFEIPFAPPGVYSLAVDGKPAQVVEVRERRPVDLGVLQLPE